MVPSVLRQGALDQGAEPGVHPQATAIRNWQPVEDLPVIPQDREVGQGVQVGGQEAMEKGQEAMEEDQEAMEEDQELLPEGREVSLDGPGAQEGGPEALYGDQRVPVGDQEVLDQGAGRALLKGGRGGEAQVEEGLPPTRHTGDQVHHPRQGHVALPLKS